MSKKPLICLPANLFDYRGSPGHIVRDTYIRALTEIADVMTVMTPIFEEGFDANALLKRVDGIVLTGSGSHVSPALYHAPCTFDPEHLSPERDATSLNLIRAALDADKPLLGICRGFQELNVVMGGTLYQNLTAETDSILHHGYIEGETVTEGYERRAHNVIVEKGGYFDRWKAPDTFVVNTIHEQGVKTHGDGIHIEARAEDGLVEAISVKGQKFALGVQWHPEGDYHINATSRLIFEKFGESF